MTLTLASVGGDIRNYGRAMAQAGTRVLWLPPDAYTLEKRRRLLAGEPVPSVGVQFMVEKRLDDDLDRPPHEIVVGDSNMILNAGADRLVNRLIGVAAQALDSANCRIGVGNSSTAAAVGQTDLQAAAGSGNRQFALCNTVSLVSNALQVVADFATGEANFAWNEWGIDFGTADGTTVVAPLLNRRVASLGTKATGTWTHTATITFAG